YRITGPDFRASCLVEFRIPEFESYSARSRLMSAPAPTRFTLRQLPLPAKLVVTCFMLTVGLGYSSAMVQLHFQHTQADGSPMPGKNDVIEIFAGKKWVTKEEAEKLRQKSRFETLVSGPRSEERRVGKEYRVRGAEL